MPDHFLELQLPRRAALSDEEVRARFHELSRCFHPDSGSEPDREAFERLSRAQSELTSSAKRLWNLLELTYGAERLEKKGGIDAGVADFFPVVAESMGKANAVLAKRKQAATELTRALIEGEAAKARRALSLAIERIDAEIGLLESGLPQLDELVQRGEAEGLEKGLDYWRSLTFFEKWKGQIQQKFAELF